MVYLLAALVLAVHDSRTLPYKAFTFIDFHTLLMLFNVVAKALIQVFKRKQHLSLFHSQETALRLHLSKLVYLSHWKA